MSQVYKFGGSTIKSADALRSIANIVLNAKDLRVVVLSATYNSTNELEEIGSASKLSLIDSEELTQSFFDKHTVLCDDLEIGEEVKSFLIDLKAETNSISDKIHLNGELSPLLMDSLYSIGERLSSYILFSYLKKTSGNDSIEFLDSRDHIITNSEFSLAVPIFFELDKMKEALSKDKVYITQGFIGRDLKGNTTTLGREGSDYSASLFSWALSTDKLVIWKDVKGIYQADPKLLASAKILEKLSYEQAELLTEKGAKVLFPRTMQPLRERKIDLVVKSTFYPNESGTTISTSEHKGLIGITTRDHDDKVVISLLGENLFKVIDEESLLSTLSAKGISHSVYEYGENCFSVLVKKQDLKGVAEIFSKNFL